MYLKFYRTPFRLGIKTYHYGVIYRMPFGLYRALGKEM